MERTARAILAGATTWLVAALLLPAPASATTATLGPPIRDGGTLRVSGTASFTNEPFVSLGSDAAADAHPGGDALGRDITGLSISTGANDTVSFRWHLSQLAPTGRGIDAAYGTTFCVEPSESPNCWSVMFVDVGGVSATNSFVAVRKCADDPCPMVGDQWLYTLETDVYDANAKTATATVPALELGITPGSSLRSTDAVPFGSSVFSTSAWWFLFAGAYPTWDATAIKTTHQLPTKQVSLAIGEVGQDPAQLSYGTEATIEDSRFTGDLDVSNLPAGPYAIYARACFGPASCGYASRTVTL